MYFSHVKEQYCSNDVVAVQIGPINLDCIPFAPRRSQLVDYQDAYQKRLIHEEYFDWKTSDIHLLKTKGVPNARFRRFRKFVVKWLRDNVEIIPEEVCYDELFNEWMSETNNYSGKKKDKFRARFEELCYGMSNREKKELLEMKSFIKEEFYEEAKHPRMIISRSDDWKILVGGISHRMEKLLFHGDKTAHWFVKGTPVSEYPKRMEEIRQKWPVIMETDYSSFEGSFSNYYANICEVLLFKHVLKCHPDWFNFISQMYPMGPIERLYTLLTDKPQLNQDLVDSLDMTDPYSMWLSWMELLKRDEDGRVPHPDEFMSQASEYSPAIKNKYVTMFIPAGRKSGEMWTSLANGFSNLMNMLFLCSENRVACDGMVEGDDGFFGVSSKKLGSCHFKDLGFNIKLEYATESYELSFCGQRYNPDTMNVLISPEIINRMGWTCSRRYFKCGLKTKLKLLKGKARSAYELGCKSPMVSVLAWKIYTSLNVQEKLRRSFRFRDQHMDEVDLLNPPEVNYSDRLMYEKMFGVSPQEQIRFEDEIISSPDLRDFHFPFRDFYNNVNRIVSNAEVDGFPTSDQTVHNVKFSLKQWKIQQLNLDYTYQDWN